jgi:hypothetical protein
MDSEDIVRKFHQKRGQIRDPEKIHPGSGSRIPDPGGKKALDPGSGSATLVLWKDHDYYLVSTIFRFHWLTVFFVSIKSAYICSRIHQQQGATRDFRTMETRSLP